MFLYKIFPKSQQSSFPQAQVPFMDLALQFPLFNFFPKFSLTDLYDDEIMHTHCSSLEVSMHVYIV